MPDLFVRPPFTGRSLVGQALWTLGMLLVNWTYLEVGELRWLLALTFQLYNLEERSRSWLNAPNHLSTRSRSLVFLVLLLALSYYVGWLPGTMMVLVLGNIVSRHSTRLVPMTADVGADDNSVAWGRTVPCLSL